MFLLNQHTASGTKSAKISLKPVSAESTDTIVHCSRSQVLLDMLIGRGKWRRICYTMRKGKYSVADYAMQFNPLSQDGQRMVCPKTTWHRTAEKEHKLLGKSWGKLKRISRTDNNVAKTWLSITQEIFNQQRKLNFRLKLPRIQFFDHFTIWFRFQKNI